MSLKVMKNSLGRPSDPGVFPLDIVFNAAKQQSTLGNTVSRDGRVERGVKPNLFACNLRLGCYSTPITRTRVNRGRLVRLASDVTEYVIVHFLLWSCDQYRAWMLKSHITNNNIDPVYTLPDPYGHDINFNSFKTRVDFQLKMILQNLIKTSHRKGGWSKYDRKHPELDVLTTRIRYHVNGVIITVIADLRTVFLQLILLSKLLTT